MEREQKQERTRGVCQRLVNFAPNEIARNCASNQDQHTREQPLNQSQQTEGETIEGGEWESRRTDRCGGRVPNACALGSH